MKNFLCVLLMLGFGSFCLAAPPSGSRQPAEFIDGESNLRDGPGTSFKILFQPTKGAECVILTKKDPWLQVEFSDGKTGWVHKKNLKLKEATEETNEKSTGFAKTSCDIDLDKDGVPEVVALEMTGKPDPKGTGDTYHLVVYKKSSQGKTVIWEDTRGRFSCFIGDTGVEDLQIVGDINADGRVELIIPDMHSDVSPSTFRILQWNGSGFEIWMAGYLKAENEKNDTFTLMKKIAENEKMTWVLHFESLHNDGSLNAVIAGNRKSKICTGRAQLKFDDFSFKVLKWLEPLTER